MATRVTYPIFKAFTASGTFGTGYKLYTYAAGTDTPLTVYKNEAGTTPHLNPIILNAKGEEEIFITQAAKFTLTDASGNIQTGWPVDNIDPVGIVADEVAYTPTGVLVSTNVQDALDELEGVAEVISTDLAGISRQYIIGGEITVTGATSFDVAPVTCMSEDGNINITIATTTSYTFPGGSIATDQVWRVWVYKSKAGLFDVWVDYDANGANLPTTDWVAWRKIGFVAQDSSVLKFRHQSGEMVSCPQPSASLIVATIGASFATVDHSNVIAEEMVEAIEYGCKDGATAGTVLASDDGTNVSFAVGTTISTATDTNLDAWGAAASQKAGLKAYKANRQFKATTGTLDLLLQGYKLKR